MKACLVLNGKLYRGNFEEGFILCADGGYDMVKVKGIVPNAILGDMDSILSKPEESIEIIKYDAKKDFTDGELALDYLLEKGYDDIYVYGVEGGRLDHVLTNLGIMRRATEAGVKITMKCNDYDIFICDKKFSCECGIGDRISLVPFGGEVHIISTKGLEYPLSNETLYNHQARGISNIAIEPHVEVEIGNGVCFIFKILH